MGEKNLKLTSVLALLLVSSLILAAGASFAEEAVPVAAPDPEIQAMSTTDVVTLTVSTIRLRRQYIVASAMGLTDAEGAAFWPVYADYWEEMGALREKLMALTDEFIRASQSLTEAEANKMIADYLQIRQDEFTIKQKYVEKFKAALPAVKVARYYQIENKLDSIVNYELAKVIPLAKAS